MKKRFLISMFGLLSLSVHYSAQADAQSAYQNCLDNAKEYSRICGSSDECSTRYERRVDSCLKNFNERLDSESRGARYDNSGRFVPQQIPQRSTFILPGSR